MKAIIPCGRKGKPPAAQARAVYHSTDCVYIVPFNPLRGHTEGIQSCSSNSMLEITPIQQQQCQQYYTVVSGRMDQERAPLLQRDGKSKDSTPLSKSKEAGYGTQTNRARTRTISSVRIARHITLPHAIGIMVGTVAGTGIFVSPTGVTQQVCP